MERVRIRHLMVWIHKSQKQTSYVIMDPSVISRQRQIWKYKIIMYKEKKEAYDDKSGSNRPGRSF